MKKGVVEPLYPGKTYFQQKKEVLRTVYFLKKRCGYLNDRMCVDGRKQRLYITKDESSLSTVLTEALIETLVIDKNEGRDIVTADVVEVYFNADMDNFFEMKIEGMMVDFMVKSDSGKYSSHVRTHKNEKVLSMKIVKALYRCTKLGLLWYNLFSETLRKIGFSLNPYDLCVANKVTNGKSVLLHGTLTT